MKILYCTKYYNDGRDICHKIKEGDLQTIKKVAQQMAKLVPKDCVLVPIPSHFGYANTTLDLAFEISRITGCPIENILSGRNRKSAYLAKKEGNPLLADDLCFSASRQPSKTPCFIDNVYDTGETMKSAYMACNNTGIGLVYAIVR